MSTNLLRSKAWRGLFALALATSVGIGVASTWKGSTQQVEPRALIDEPDRQTGPGASDDHTIGQRPLRGVLGGEPEVTPSARSGAETAATVHVLLDAQELELVANTPLKVGLFKGLKTLDSCVIAGGRARLSTLTSGAMVVAVDTTTMPSGVGFIDSNLSVQREWGQWRAFAEVELGPAEEGEVSLRFIPSGILTVSVFDPGGQPLEGATLALRSVDVPRESQSVESDSAGIGIFKGLRPGEYMLKAREANLSGHSFRASRLQVEPGSSSTARLQPEVAGASVSGMLTDLSGRPLEGAAIALSAEESSTRRAVTRSDGGFLFEGLLAGEVTIAVLNQELPLKPGQPAMDIVRAPRAERLLLLPSEEIDLPELAVELEERPTLAIHVFAPDHITKDQIVVRQLAPRDHRASFPTAVEFRAGTSLIKTVRVRRPREGTDRLVTLWLKDRCMASTLIKADSPLKMTVYLE